MVFADYISYYSDMAEFKLKSVFKSQPIWQQAIVVLIFNSLVALLIKSIVSDSSFYDQFLLSQSIGLSIFLSFIISASFFQLKLKTWKILLPLFIGTPIGIVIMITIQAVSLNLSFDFILSSLRVNYTGLFSILFSGLFFGAIILIFFVHRDRIYREENKLQTEKISNLDHKKTIAETNLRLLQAQIEPHFLFNTLSNVISLIEIEPEKSKRLLQSLTDFLRASLKRSTEIDYSLKNELILIADYLDIFKIRLGKRLEFNIELQENINECVFPPFLLQPLVENAISHGIEPLVEGGRIDISIKKHESQLVITVFDTGKGLAPGNIKGFGLSNIRKRINSIYGANGILLIEGNKSGGVTAIIEVPYEPL